MQIRSETSFFLTRELESGLAKRSDSESELATSPVMAMDTATAPAWATSPVMVMETATAPVWATSPVMVIVMEMVTASASATAKVSALRN